jgi:hypothetical protein
MSSGTPITRMRRVGCACVPLCENDEGAVETSEGFDMQTTPCGELQSAPSPRKAPAAAQNQARTEFTGNPGQLTLVRDDPNGPLKKI